MSKSITWVTVIAIFVCIAFFITAFFITRPNRDNIRPVVCVTVASDAGANAITNHVMYSECYQEKLKTILHDRESIVTAEHERFRAELGTWLSIFGLLAILATIMVATFSFACQQASLKDEKDDVKRQFKELDERFEKLKLDLESEYKEKKGQIVNAGAAAVTEIRGESSATSEMVSNDATWQNELVPLQNKSTEFIKMWSRSRRDCEGGRFDEKIELGISTLKDFNALIDKRLATKEMLGEILNKLNVFNIYLGQRTVRDSEFYDKFLWRMRQDRPLSVPPDEVEKALEGFENGAIRAGYYMKLYKLQEIA